MENPSLSDCGLLDRFFAERTLGKEYREDAARFLGSLMQSARQGHLCWRPSAEERRIGEALPLSAAAEGKELFPKTPVVRQEGRYYLQRNWVYETHLLQQTKRLRGLRSPSFFDGTLFEKSLQIELDRGKLLPEQAQSLRAAFEHPFSLICGGPGTGKTYISGFLIRLLGSALKKDEKKKMRICIAAPTGKAAAHLQSSFLSQWQEADPALQFEATTIHRLLQLRPGQTKLFSGRKIDADLILVDEASMLDAPLFAHLLEAIGPETRLVLIGDPDQLPPVETGSLFAEMADLFATRLQKSLRTEEKHLQAFAEAVNQGDSQQAERLLQTPDPSLRRLDWEFDGGLLPKILNEVRFPFFSSEPDPQILLKEMNAFRILGSLRQGPFGTDAINRAIVQEMARRIKPGQWWAVPILVTVNAPRLDLYNGSGGILIGKSKGGLNLSEGTAFFPGSRSEKEIPCFEPAFCLSVHKSQGSEFERVLALFPPGSENFGREAIYTAATRSKKRFEFAAAEGILPKMLAQRSRKDSGFTERFLEGA